MRSEQPMGVKLHSYINFDGNAKAAVEFYKSIFGGEVYMDTFRSFKDKSDMSVDDADLDKVMHAFLKGDNGIELMVSDRPTGMPMSTGSQMSLTLSGDDEDTMRGFWSKLSADGQVTAPLEKAPWGDTFGMLTDKFGIAWMVNIGPDQLQL